jgi:hypothetical protein
MIGFTDLGQMLAAFRREGGGRQFQEEFDIGFLGVTGFLDEEILRDFFGVHGFFDRQPKRGHTFEGHFQDVEFRGRGSRTARARLKQQLATWSLMSPLILVRPSRNRIQG